MNDSNITMISRDEVINLIKDLNTTIMNKTSISNLINEKLINNIDGINSSISNVLTLLFGALTTYFLFIAFNFFQKKKIIKDVILESHKEINEEIKNLKEENKIEFNRHIKNSINENRKESQKDEYIRNLIFYDLSKMLASDINENGENNLKKVFNLYSTRLLIATQLTSGEEKQIKFALRKLSLKVYYRLLSLKPVKDYIETLEERDDMDIFKELEDFKRNKFSRKREEG